jgi:hypothetical protein
MALGLASRDDAAGEEAGGVEVAGEPRVSCPIQAWLESALHHLIHEELLRALRFWSSFASSIGVADSAHIRVRDAAPQRA